MTKAEIVAEIDEIECELYSLYKRIERLRLNLQADWRVKPSDYYAAQDRLGRHERAARNFERRLSRPTPAAKGQE